VLVEKAERILLEGLGATAAGTWSISLFWEAAWKAGAKAASGNIAGIVSQAADLDAVNDFGQKLSDVAINAGQRSKQGGGAILWRRVGGAALGLVALGVVVDCLRLAFSKNAS
jgi:hypothetical protein